MLERTTLSRKVFEDIKSQAEAEMAKNLKQVELAIAPYMKRITDYPGDPQTVYAGLAGLKDAIDRAMPNLQECQTRIDIAEGVISVYYGFE